MIQQLERIIKICSEGRQINSFQLRSMLISISSNLKTVITEINQLQANNILSAQKAQTHNKKIIKFPGADQSNYQSNHEVKQHRKHSKQIHHQNHWQHDHKISLHKQSQLKNAELAKNKLKHNFQNQNDIKILGSGAPSRKISYPIRFTYVNRIPQWWPPQKIAAGMGVPGFASPTMYNYIALAFWSFNGSLDLVKVWADPLYFFGQQSVFGKSSEQIRKNLRAKYNQKGIKVLVSAFGGTQFPTTSNINPVQCAQKLGKFVMQNQLDGVDVDWQDNAAMQQGKGQDWLIKFQIKLRQLLPNHIICHAPQAPYFKQEHYKNGAYVTVDRKVGNTIDFYNVQFYNQGDTKYDTYQTLFLSSGSYFSGTSVNQIVKRGIPSNKIVIGKPISQSDASNTGVVAHRQLGQWIKKAESQLGWRTGVMYWQYISDVNGQCIQQSTGCLGNQQK